MTVLIEDDPSIRKLVEYSLSSNGISIVSFPSGEDAFESDLKDAELFILDIMLPGMDGMEILSRIRKDPVLGRVPVIMLTAKDSEYDIAKGLDDGADDYIPKPFGILELISRVKAAIRRGRMNGEEKKKETLSSGDINMDVTSHRAYLGDREISLTQKEYALLEYFLTHKGIALSRDKLLTEVWGYNYVGETRTVDVHIRHLREKLGTEGDKIETVKGLGYRFSGE
ncbi:MAG: response regulator transcription factor [Candidatus Ornithospirochaeta sp.]|nr:response regulator transcription factor [Sphaerochaetaceae bacterium]MDY5522513.1 response regulator transcription factor [Candidatus Ornithospirochaeta sp.]